MARSGADTSRRRRRASTSLYGGDGGDQGDGIASFFGLDGGAGDDEMRGEDGQRQRLRRQRQ